jgi:hypothetical protein
MVVTTPAVRATVKKLWNSIMKAKMHWPYMKIISHTRMDQSPSKL